MNPFYQLRIWNVMLIGRFDVAQRFLSSRSLISVDSAGKTGVFTIQGIHLL